MLMALMGAVAAMGITWALRRALRRRLAPAVQRAKVA